MAGSGFVDLQVNGYGGVNFSDPGLSLEEVAWVCDQLAQRGTAAFCPTVITAPMEIYRRALPVLAAARHLPGCTDRLLGMHLEGPFLSAQDGAVGAHPRAHIQMPSLAIFDELYALADGQIALLTIAPEQPGALDLVRHAVRLGVVVSIGHTLAGEREVRAAVEAGALLSTHLGNGCPNLIHRHHNPIWPQLAARELTAMLITDGHHLPPALIGACLAAKGPSGIIITSDSAPAAGLPPGEYSFFGTRALLEPSGRLRNLQADTLAGSSATMLHCMNHLASLGLLEEGDLWKVGRDNPLAMLRMQPAGLPGGNVHFQDGRFVLMTE